MSHCKHKFIISEKVLICEKCGKHSFPNKLAGIKKHKKPIIEKSPRGITLTKKDMYDKKGECILPQGSLKKHRNCSKFNPS